MSLKQRIVIQDACVLFDLIDLHLFDLFFQLGYRFLTTPQVMNEVKEETQKKLIKKKLENGNLDIDSHGELEEILELLKSNRALSLADSSVLELAFRTRGTILSSDGSLRRAAQSNGIEVHGMIWIIEMFVANGLLDKEKAIAVLIQYKSINAWSPKNEIEKAIKKLK